jgi:citrate synthase
MSDEIYSPGLEGIIAGETAVSTITAGLSYRGYSITELAESATWEETLYLILHGDLPTRVQLDGLNKRLAAAAQIPDALVSLLRALPATTNMMDVMRTTASVLGHYDPEAQDLSHDANLRKAERLAVQLPIAMAAARRIRQGKSLVAYDDRLSLSANILWMLSETRPSAEAESAMQMSLIMYAEHEFNASTFAARVICSTLADLHSAITGAIGALKGHLHGGANEKVLEVLQQVGSPDFAESWVRDALAKKVRIMGFGHRVYKDGDPRATLLRPLCQKLAAQTGNTDMETIADTIEHVVRTEKKLPPNADWPSARLYYYLGLPVELYTPLFVVSRVSGWSAHVIEQLDNNRLIRPRAKYVGAPARHFVPMDERPTH